jgi:hypothetical protein
MDKILALWAVPRSTSTAFECMMRERGDFLIFDEPFGLSYYYSEQRRNSTRYPDIPPNPEYNFRSTLTRLKQDSQKQPIFMKDMAYYVPHLAGDADFLSHFYHTFLIRHPAKSLPSLFARWPDFTLEEAGYAELYTLFQRVRENSGSVPILIDSDDLLQKPAATVKAYCNAVGIPFIQEALSWNSRVRPDINQWEGGWHTYLESSRGFQERKDKQYTNIEDNAHLQRAYEFCLPYYQKLHQCRLQVE